MTGPFTLVEPAQDIAGSLRRLADELEAGEVDLVLVVLSDPERRHPSVRAFGRDARSAEVDGLLLQAAMLPTCPG